MSDIEFAGRVALVTGGGNGLGREYCLELARRGARVIVNDLGGSGSGLGQSGAAADAVVDEIRAAGGQAVADHGSVASRASAAAMVAKAVESFGRLDIAIINAGVLRNNRFEDLTDDEIDIVLDVHLKGAGYVAQPAYREMARNGYGRFLFTGSASAMFGHAWQANYAAAKGAMVGLSNTVAIEGARHAILSNVILPTAGDTRLREEMLPGFMEAEPFATQMKGVDFAAIRPEMTSAYNVPLALYLVSEACRDSHGVYSQCAGRYARVFMGPCDGWLSPRGEAPSSDDVAAHWNLISRPGVPHRPESLYEEIALVVDQRKAGN